MGEVADWLDAAPKHRRKRTRRERAERSARRNRAIAAEMRAIYETGKWATWALSLADHLDALAERQERRLGGHSGSAGR
jgi:hypothetical protein